MDLVYSTRPEHSWVIHPSTNRAPHCFKLTFSLEEVVFRIKEKLWLLVKCFPSLVDLRAVELYHIVGVWLDMWSQCISTGTWLKRVIKYILRLNMIILNNIDCIEKFKKKIQKMFSYIYFC